MALTVRIKELNERTRLLALCLNTSAAGTFVSGVIAPLVQPTVIKNAGIAGTLTLEAIGLHLVGQIVLSLVRQEP